MLVDIKELNAFLMKNFVKTTVVKISVLTTFYLLSFAHAWVTLALIVVTTTGAPQEGQNLNLTCDNWSFI